MKLSSRRSGLARSLVALAVSFALILSTHILAFASPANSAIQTDSSQPELQLTSATATASAAGVLLHWSTNSTADNLGFNVYRLKDGRRTRVNREIIPGALFAPGTPALRRAGYSYGWFDRGGTVDSTYVIESVSVAGSAKIHAAISPVVSNTASGFEQSGSNASATESTDMFEKQYPAAENLINSPQGTIQEQWAIAAQTALKIAIKKDGWYRVTQQQMVAAGFNPTVDIRNLRLFVDANEVAILTNQLTGPFGSGDFIEFYGRGLDLPTTDTRIYYLIAGTTPGKRVLGEIQLDEPPIDPPFPTSTPPLPVTPPITSPIVPVPTPITPFTQSSTGSVLRDPIFQNRSVNLSWLLSTEQWNRIEAKSQNVPLDPPAAVDRKADRATFYSPPDEMPAIASDSPSEKPAAEQPARVNDSVRQDASTAANATPVSARPSAAKIETPAPQPNLNQGRRLRKRTASRKKTKRKLRRQLRQERNHALAADGFAAANFDHTIEIKDRTIYYSNLLNGDVENWFGVVIGTPVNLNLTVPGPDLTATAPATLEFALQGVLGQGNPHQVSVEFNGVTLGSVGFSPLEHVVATFPIPIALIQSGANTLRFTPNSTTSIVDYVRLTYPHPYKADSGKLKFSLRGNQTRTVDGFSTPSVRLIDYTDPLAVSITRPVSEPSASGYAITVPVSESYSKNQRLLYAIPEGQFDQPAALSLSQPSTLNLNANTGDFLIISHKNFIPSFTTNVGPPLNTSLVAQRQAQSFSVSVVDVDDVYDEFSYGVHGPKAIKDFLQHAFTNWATPPRYVIFAGDASLDPRNYQGSGSFDFVPTKLVDATFSEASSDDWLTDFNADGVADIPVGRLPFRTVADADLVISKIVNFTPANVPSHALLVADQDEFNIYGFAETNDTFQSLLPAGMTVQRLNRAPQPPGVPSQPSAQVRADIIAGFNQGRALVNYSGHGNVDVWTGSNLFNSADAMALTNGNKLSFVVVMDCLNGYFQDPVLLSLSEAFMKAPGGGAVAAFASSGLTFAQGQHLMGEELYTQLYGAQPIAVGDAIKLAKGATFDIDVRRTWIFFGDPSMKIR